MPSTQKFLFVNKTAKSKSLSRSSGTERFQIFSHVQPESRISSRTRGSSVSTSFESDEAEKPNDAKPPSDRLPERTLCITSPSSMRAMTRIKRKKNRSVAIPYYSLSPLVTLGISEFDPFKTTAAPIDETMGGLLTFCALLTYGFYRSSMAQRVYPTQELTQLALRQVLLLAWEYPVVMNSLLCMTSAGLHSFANVEEQAVKSLHYKGRALQNLKYEISQRDKNTWGVYLAYSVALLLSTELLQGNVTEIEAHLKGMEQIVHHIHGVHDAPVALSMIIFESYYLCTALLQIQPTLKPSMLFNAETVTSPIKLRFTLSSAGSSFFKPQTADALGHQILEMVSKQRSFLELVERCFSGVLQPTCDEWRIIYARQMCVDYHLLLLPFGKTDGPLTPFQEAARLALYVSAQPIIHISKPSSTFARGMAAQLQDALVKVDMLAHCTPNREMVLWMLLLGLYITICKKQRAWYSGRISEVLESLDLHTVDQVDEVLQGFYNLGPSHSMIINDALAAAKAGHGELGGPDEKVPLKDSP